MKNWAYKNLAAEMARRGIGVEKLRSALCICKATIYRKLAGKTAFTIDEAIKIKCTFFPSLSYEYLFKKEVPQDDD